VRGRGEGRAQSQARILGSSRNFGNCAGVPWAGEIVTAVHRFPQKLQQRDCHRLFLGTAAIASHAPTSTPFSQESTLAESTPGPGLLCCHQKTTRRFPPVTRVGRRWKSSVRISVIGGNLWTAVWISPQDWTSFILAWLCARRTPSLPRPRKPDQRYSPTIGHGSAVFHLPRVKSGNSIGLLPFPTDHSLSGPTAERAAAS